MRKKKEVIQKNIELEEEKPSFKNRLFKALFNWKSFASCLIILGFIFAYGLYSYYVEDVQNLSFKVAALFLGKLFFALPVMLWVIGLKIFLGKKFTWTKAGVIGNLLLLICGLGICHKIFDPKDVSAVKNYMEGGGVFGYFIVKGITALVGEGVLWVVLSVGLWVGLAFLMPVSLVEKIWNWFKGLWGSKKSQDEDEDDDKAKPLPKRKQNLEPNANITKEEPKTQSAGFPMARDSGFKNTNQARRTHSEGLDPRDIYHREEFTSFSDGIDKKPVYKKFLDFGKSNPYKDIKEEIHEDPVQLPEWEQNPQEHLPWPEDLPEGVAPWDADKRDIAQGRMLSTEDLPEGVDPWDADKRNLAQEKILRWEEIVEEQEAKQQEVGTTDECYAIGSSKAGSVIVNYYEDKKTQAQTEAEDEVPKKITIEDSADKIEGEVLTEAEAKAREEKKKTPPKKKSKYVKPPVTLLNPPVKADRASWEAGVKEQCELLEKTLADFKVRARVINVTRGPSVTRFELEPAPGVKVASIVNLADDIALRLAAPGVRIEAPIPGKSAVGIEAPNIKNDMVAFREVVDTDIVKKDPSRLAIGLGKNISGTIISADLGKMPHTLIAGSTGSGKSVCVNTIIAGLLYKADPDEVKLILVDPKVVELSNYNGIPHLLTPVVTDPKKAASALRWGVNEMERRYQLFADNHVREITSFNKKEDVEKLPYIVIIIDELADLMMVAKVDVEEAILRLAQKARACGIHLILATQRPSVDVITGIVKANIPSRIAFAVSSQTDSRTILDGSGAEKLLGKGDMLFKPVGVNTAMRVQGAFVTDDELAKIVEFVKNQGIATEYNDEVTKVELSSDKEKAPAAEANSEAGGDSDTDALFEDALRLVLDTGQVSSSMLQRRFRIGYTRAARLVDTFEELGIVGQSVGAKPREVIMSRQEAEERFLNK